MSRKGNSPGREIAELARLLPVPQARDFPVGREQTIKEHLMTELSTTDTSRGRAGDRSGRRRRTRLGVAAASVLAVALTAAVVVGAHNGFAPGKPGGHSAAGAGHGAVTGPGTPATPAALLAKIARVAAHEPAQAVRNGEFMYIRSEVAYSVDTFAHGHETSVMEKLHERQIWLPVANICVTGLLIENGVRTPLSPFPVVNGKIDRSPETGNEPRPNFKCPSEGHLGDVTYRLMQAMPTGRAALLRYLRAGKRWTNDGPVTEIGDLIWENIVPPKLAAALYLVAARLPGAMLVPGAVNAVGERGIGIAWTSTSGGDEYRIEWIFSRKTLQFIGERDYNARTGAVYGESAILRRAFVGKAGQLP
jgi:hypothetical protein